MRKKTVGRPAEMVACGWCRKKFPVTELRHGKHYANCPKRPKRPMASEETA